MRPALCCVFVFASTAALAFELDERPARPNEWGYRPAAGASVELNPPGFTWRPTEDAETYYLQIGRDEAFTDLSYETETRWSSHCPPTTLPEGTLYWRYRAVGGSKWSKVREFTVPPEAVAYPQPTVAELKSRLPDERPRLFMRPDELSRNRALAEGDLNAEWRSVQRAADRLLQNPPDTTEPPKYPEGTVYKSGEWREIWWGNRRRSIAVADGAATLAFAYRITADENYGKAARDLLLALTKWDPEGATNYHYNDEAAMPILYMASRAYDWAYPVLSDDDRARIIEMQRIRGEQCFNHLTRRQHLWRPYGSHTQRAWHKLAELATAFIGDFPEAETWLDYAMTVYFTCYPVWNDSDGGWHEGVAYWNSYLSRFMHWAFVMDRAYAINAFERPFFRRAGYYPMYVMPPGTRHGGFGDMGPRMHSGRVAQLTATLASGAGNAHWRWFADQHDADFPSGYVGFFAAARSHGLAPEAPLDLPDSIVFQGVGVAALNTSLLDADQNVQILFKSSPMGTISHGYNGQNSFQLNVGGRPLLQNTGQRDIHGSPHHTEWMWHAKSQNAILVDGEGFTTDRYRAVGRITQFQTSNRLDVVAGEAGDAYPALERWTRRIVFIKPNLFIIHDVLDAKQPSTFQFLLHAPGEFQLGSPNSGSFTANHGSVEFRFLHPVNLDISQTDGYDPPPADWSDLELDEWHLTASTREKATHQQFLTLFRVNEQDFEGGHTETDGGFDVRLIIDNGTHRIRFYEDAFHVTSGDKHWTFSDAR